MKEVESKSEWVGRTITCKTCNRSYKIEAGDIIFPAYYSSCGLFDLPKRFRMPCEHNFEINE